MEPDIDIGGYTTTAKGDYVEVCFDGRVTADGFWPADYEVCVRLQPKTATLPPYESTCWERSSLAAKVEAE